MISSERASQEEQNGTNFSSLAPSSEELLMGLQYSLWIMLHLARMRKEPACIYIHFYCRYIINIHTLYSTFAVGSISLNFLPKINI